MAMKYGLISTVAASVAAGAMAAQWTGAGSTTEWSNPDNWENGTVGSADVRIEAANVTGSNSKVITFDAPYTFTDLFHVYAGTAEDPVIFRATGENGLAAQNDKEMYVGNGAANSGYLVLDGGFYLFKNDLKPGWNQSEGTVVVKSGTKVDVDYWIHIGDGSGGTGTGRLVVDGGDVYCGRKQTSNGAITIGRGKGSKGELIVSGGSFRSSERSGEPALRVADGENSIGNMLVSGGTVQSDGEADIGYGNGSTATAVMKDGTWNVTGRLYVGATGCTANGTLTLDGGMINASQDFRIGDKSSTGKVI